MADNDDYTVEEDKPHRRRVYDSNGNPAGWEPCSCSIGEDHYW